MIDEICKYLYSKMTTEEWTNVSELREIIKRQNLKTEEAETVMDFLKKYFLEVDESKQRARLNPWASSLFGTPVS